MWVFRADDLEKFFTGDAVKHILEVQGDEAARRSSPAALRLGNVPVNGELRCPDDEIHATLHADREVKGKQVRGKRGFVDHGDVVGDDAAKGGRNANGA